MNKPELKWLNSLASSSQIKRTTIGNETMYVSGLFAVITNDETEIPEEENPHPNLKRIYTNVFSDYADLKDCNGDTIVHPKETPIVKYMKANVKAFKSKNGTSMVFDATILSHVYNIVKPDTCWLHRTKTTDEKVFNVLYMENFKTYSRAIVLEKVVTEQTMHNLLVETAQLSNAEKPQKPAKDGFESVRRICKDFLKEPREAMHYAFPIADSNQYLYTNGFLAVISDKVPRDLKRDDSYKQHRDFGNNIIKILDNVGSEIEVDLSERVIDGNILKLGDRWFNNDYYRFIEIAVNPTHAIAENEKPFCPIHLYNDDTGAEAVLLPIRH